MGKRFKKSLSILIIFVLTVANYGFPLKALAAEGSSFFGFNFFKKDEIELKAYFGDDEKEDELVADVNDLIDVTLEVTPLVEEYLRDGTIKFGLKDGGENNFKIESVSVEELVEETEEVKEVEEEVLEVDKIQNTVENAVETNKIETSIENVVENTVVETVKENKIESSIETDEVPAVDVVTEEELELLAAIEEEEVVGKEYEVKLVGENEIQLTNIIETTKIFVKMAYKQNDKVNIEDLYSDLEVVLEGHYIDEDLEVVDITEKEELTLGWTYSKDFELASEFVKVSPFVVGDVKGTILEQVVTVKRDTEGENSLPVKETMVKIQIPEINGKLPIGINVSSNKLMATLGYGAEETNFTEKNWTYDFETGLLEIKIENKNALIGNGEDKFEIICRYEEYIEEENIDLEKAVEATVVVYSAEEDVEHVKSIKDIVAQEIKAGELMSCLPVEADDTINKARITANHYANVGYETEFINEVNLTILTSDILEDVVLETAKQEYVDIAGNRLDANPDVKYKGVRFNYNEIKEMLEKGTTIDILDVNDTVLYNIAQGTESTAFLFEEKMDNIKIRINDVAVNKKLSVEFVKTIDTSIYSAKDFVNIDKLESKIDVKVKYGGFEDIFKILEVTNEVKFANTVTDVKFVMNKSSLSSMQKNENVEFKIELMNDSETSDLYRNPTFEIVFPDYIKEVTVNSINMLYKNGLSIVEDNVFNENGRVKLRINTEGIQQGYNFSSMTNGTNIIIDANIVVDELAPKRDDIIKLYYYNEIATNYKTETHWSISKALPVDIYKITNGYNSTVFSYNTPTGFITSNGVENFDNAGSKLQTVMQGKVLGKVDMNAGTKIATMNLAAVNNTGNMCTDVIMLGRIPGQDSTDVITGEKLLTNINTQLIGEINQSDKNSVNCDIYYSYNANANKNLNDANNSWMKAPVDFAQVKSFLIVPTEAVKAGTAFKFSYNFQIPENLPYEAEIYGNFGAYYNNHLSFVTVYETSKADLVGLVTDLGPRLEATLSVDAGDGMTVLGGSRLKYTVKVENVGSVRAEDVKVDVTIPKNTNYVKKSINQSLGDYGFEELPNVRKLTLDLGSIDTNETKEGTYYVKVNQKKTLDAYADGKDDTGYYLDKKSGKEYITEVPAMIITNKSIVKSSIMAEAVETNEVSNEVEAVNFDIETRLSYDRSMNPGMETTFELYAKNISGIELENAQAIFDFGNIYEYKEAKVSNVTEELNDEITVDPDEGKVYFNLGNMKHNEIKRLSVTVVSKVIDSMKEAHICQFEIKADNLDESQKGTAIEQIVEMPWIDAENITAGMPETINEGDTVTIGMRVSNNSNRQVIDGSFEVEIPNFLDVTEVRTGTGRLLTYSISNGKVTNYIPTLLIGESIDLYMTVKAKNMPGQDSTLAQLTMVAKNVNQPDIAVGPIEFNIVNSEKTEEEIIKEKNEEFKKQEEEYQKEQAANKENGSNGSSSDVSHGGGSNNGTNNNGNNNGNNNNNNNANNSNNNNNNTNNQQTNDDKNTNKEQTNNNNNQTSESKPESAKTYNITGIVWYDANKNGSREDSEKGIGSVKVFLLDAKNKVLKTTTTGSNGKYTFDKLVNDKYVVAFLYDENIYEITSYLKSGVAGDRNSDAIRVENDEMNAVTNAMMIDNAHVGNIDLGLQNKDNFDMKVSKYISKVVVTTDKDTQTYEYDNEEIAKIDIHSKRIDGARVDLEYTIRVENVGSIDGNAEQIKDYLPEGVEFDEAKNKEWQKGDDGSIFIKNTNNVTLKPGDKKDYKLFVTKVMTEDNTGIVSNKAEIIKATTKSNETELDKENNVSVQNTIITVSTGKTTQVVLTVTFVTLVVIVIVNRKRLPINFSSGKVYKTENKDKRKNKLNFKKNFK